MTCTRNHGIILLVTRAVDSPPARAQKDMMMDMYDFSEVLNMKKLVDTVLVAALLMNSIPGLAEDVNGAVAPPPAQTAEIPDGQAPDDMPLEMPDGQAPDGMPPEKPDGQPPMGGPGGMPGGISTQPEHYTAENQVLTDAVIQGESILSDGTDENAVHVGGGTLTMTDTAVSRVSADSTGGDSASFYGVGAAVLTTNGTAEVSGCTIETDAAGGAGLFAYGDGVIRVKDTEITTRQNTSGGVHVAGGGVLTAENVTAHTYGESSAAIRSDRGGGVMVVDGGSFTSEGVGSPAVYVTADITIRGAELTAAGSEALCLEGRNAVRLYDCHLTGQMQDLPQNDNTWTVILYQSMSGDSAIGKGSFEMTGGTLTSANGGLFYTTNTESEFILSGVTIEAAEDSEYFLRCTGNANQRGWGKEGSNGAACAFTAIGQEMPGDVVWDSISALRLYLTSGSVWTGAARQDESCAGEGGDGYAVINVDESSSWIVTEDSVVSELHCAGTVTDSEGRSVTIKSPDGALYVQGDSTITVTTGVYDTACDTAGAGMPSSWEEHVV